MIKLNASYSKNIPADQDYSSQSYLACVEVELNAGASAQELQAKIHETFEPIWAGAQAASPVLLGFRPAIFVRI